MKLGEIRIREFLERTNGMVTGNLATDCKLRYYKAKYELRSTKSDLYVSRSGKKGNWVRLPSIVDIDEQTVGFLGLYSGDGAKGTEDGRDPGRIRATISFSQREPNLVRFAVDQFRRLFPGDISLTFSLGEDSAYFMAGEGYELLTEHYGGSVPTTPPLSDVVRDLKARDQQYLKERRPVEGSNEDHLAFYYFHKAAMETIMTGVKSEAVKAAGIELVREDKVTSSLRRPFKKGAREPGGSSRSDEIHVGGLSGIGELFLKIMHEAEDSVINDTQRSPQGLICWNDIPSNVGGLIDVEEFFSSSPYGQIAGSRPQIQREGSLLKGKWKGSREVALKDKIRVDPLWCYTAGLYLAEGSTSKATMFNMFAERPKRLSLGFTSSEGTSLEVMLRALQRLFLTEDCLDAWKIKVGSQYFPELVVTGLKHGVPMLRGGESGDGKLRTMEISLALKEWGLSLAEVLRSFEHRYSHVEPTGAGVARVDFWASSSLCRWYFPLLMYAVFGSEVTDPLKGFTHG